VERAEQVVRVVDTDTGTKDAIDTLVRANGQCEARVRALNPKRREEVQWISFNQSAVEGGSIMGMHDVIQEHLRSRRRFSPSVPSDDESFGWERR